MPAAAHADLAREIDELAAAASTPEQLMQTLVRRLAAVPRFDWVGFYLLDPADPHTLVLGPFVGTPTPHTRIPVDQGICGAAASSGQTIVVDDVHADPRYLACSLQTRSEIVVPVRAHRRVVGELDIDSHTPAAFSAEDRRLLEHCAALVGRLLENAAPADVARPPA